MFIRTEKKGKKSLLFKIYFVVFSNSRSNAHNIPKHMLAHFEPIFATEQTMKQQICKMGTAFRIRTQQLPDLQYVISYAND